MSLIVARCVATAVLCCAGLAVDVAAEPAQAYDATSDEVGARFVRLHRDGQHVGFKVYAIKARSVLTRMGVMPGDVVTHVHGAPTTDVAQIVNAIRAHASGAPFDLTIERAGKVVTLRS